MGSQPELFLSNLPSNISLQTFILWDISQVSLEASLAKIEELGSLPGDCDILPLVNDEELFCLAPDSVDLIISNNNLHLVNDPSLALQRMQHALQPDGVLVGSLFGEETLQELRISFTLAEGERSGGVSQHVSPF
jgi:NADH dehydrogenase [ubiquinone] 1 alpha subcomplex assembly factor 5